MWLEGKSCKVVVQLSHSSNFDQTKYAFTELKQLVYELYLKLYAIEGLQDSIIKRVKGTVWEADFRRVSIALLIVCRHE